jgi:hypothetical protein
LGFFCLPFVNNYKASQMTVWTSTGAKLQCNRSVVSVPRVRVFNVSTDKGFPMCYNSMIYVWVLTILLDPIS